MGYRLKVLGLLLGMALSAVAANTERVITYPSKDQHGDAITLSGMLSIPADKPAKGVILIPHYTIVYQEQSPSVKMTGEAQYFKDDYILVMPDLIGYGITGDRPHPYLDGELTAHNCIDMLFGVAPVLDSMGIGLDSLYVVGYSQGGASAIWTMRVLEEEYADRFHVIACYAGSGPYDVVVTYDEAIEKNRIFMPVLIPMLLIGTDAAYDLHLNYTEYFTKKTQKLYDDFLSGKKFTKAELVFKLTDRKLSHWLKKEALDTSNPEVRPLYEGLKRSSLVRYPYSEKVADQEVICPEWRPKAPLYVFHSTQDKVVTIQCAEHLRRCLQDLPNITYDFGKYGQHHKASGIFFPKVVEMMNH